MSRDYSAFDQLLAEIREFVNHPEWACVGQDNPYCEHVRGMNLAAIEMWCGLLPKDDNDIDTVLQIAATLTAETLGRTRRYLHAAATLEELPQLLHQARARGHLSMERLYFVHAALSGVPKELLERLDPLLCEFFTATERHQVLPGETAIKNFIRAQLLDLCPEVLEEQEEAKAAPETDALRFRANADGSGRINISLTHDEAHELHKIIQSVAKKEEVSAKEALLMLARKQTKAKIVLTLWGPQHGEPEYLHGAGFLKKSSQLLWKERITHTMDLSGADSAVREAHDPTPAQAAYVRGRDGTCRAPGCQVSAEECDLDHVIEYDLGGVTTASNLQCLCRKHHNQKSDGRIRVFMHHRGTCLWFYPNGHSVSTQPCGPLAAPAKRPRWGREWGSLRKRMKLRPKPSSKKPGPKGGDAQKAKPKASRSASSASPREPSNR